MLIAFVYLVVIRRVLECLLYRQQRDKLQNFLDNLLNASGEQLINLRTTSCRHCYCKSSNCRHVMTFNSSAYLPFLELYAKTTLHIALAKLYHTRFESLLALDAEI